MRSAASGQLLAALVVIVGWAPASVAEKSEYEVMPCISKSFDCRFMRCWFKGHRGDQGRGQWYLPLRSCGELAERGWRLVSVVRGGTDSERRDDGTEGYVYFWERGKR